MFTDVFGGGDPADFTRDWINGHAFRCFQQRISQGVVVRINCGDRVDILMVGSGFQLKTSIKHWVLGIVVETKTTRGIGVVQYSEGVQHNIGLNFSHCHSKFAGMKAQGKFIPGSVFPTHRVVEQVLSSSTDFSSPEIEATGAFESLDVHTT